jgi:hypothetical protein
LLDSSYDELSGELKPKNERRQRSESSPQ